MSPSTTAVAEIPQSTPQASPLPTPTPASVSTPLPAASPLASVPPSVAPSAAPVTPAADAPQSIEPLDYRVEAHAALNRALTAMTLTTDLYITAPEEGLSALSLAVVARRFDAWSDRGLLVDGVERPFTWNSATGIKLAIDLADAPWAAGSEHVVTVVGRIDWKKSTDSQGQLRRVGSGATTVLTAGDIVPLPMAAPRRAVFADPLSAPVARSIRLRLTTADPISVYGVAISGELVDGPSTGEGSDWTYEIAPARSVSMLVAPGYRRTTRSLELDGETVVVQAYGPTKSGRAGDLDTAAAALTDLWTRFGAGPYGRLKIVTAVAGGFAHEYPGLVVIGANFSGVTRRHIIRHEVAHQWWQTMVATDQGRDPWMDEALAEWSADRLDGRTAPVSPTTCSKRIDGPNHKDPDYYQSFFGANQYYDCVYKRGTRLFFAVADVVGLPALEACLADYAAANRFGAPAPTVLASALRDCGRSSAEQTAISKILAKYLAARSRP